MAVEALRPETLLREHTQVSSLRALFDVRCPDLPLDALDPAPSRDDCLDAGDQLDGLVRVERRVTA